MKLSMRGGACDEVCEPLRVEEFNGKPTAIT